jgi:hypothetical protein
MDVANTIPTPALPLKGREFRSAALPLKGSQSGSVAFPLKGRVPTTWPQAKALPFKGRVGRGWCFFKPFKGKLGGDGVWPPSRRRRQAISYVAGRVSDVWLLP